MGIIGRVWEEAKSIRYLTMDGDVSQISPDDAHSATPTKGGSQQITPIVSKNTMANLWGRGLSALGANSTSGSPSRNEAGDQGESTVMGGIGRALSMTLRKTTYPAALPEKSSKRSASVTLGRTHTESPISTFNPKEQVESTSTQTEANVISLNSAPTTPTNWSAAPKPPPLPRRSDNRGGGTPVKASTVVPDIPAGTDASNVTVAEDNTPRASAEFSKLEKGDEANEPKPDATIESAAGDSSSSPVANTSQPTTPVKATLGSGGAGSRPHTPGSGGLPPPLPRRAAARNLAARNSMILVKKEDEGEEVKKDVDAAVGKGPEEPVPKETTEEVPVKTEEAPVKKEEETEATIRDEPPSNPLTSDDIAKDKEETLAELLQPLPEPAPDADITIVATDPESYQKEELVTPQTPSNVHEIPLPASPPVIAPSFRSRQASVVSTSSVYTTNTGTGNGEKYFVGRATWEERSWMELVRIREDMFWARIGGVKL